MTRFSAAAPFAALILATALVAPLPALGQSQNDKMTKRPRDEAAMTGGEFIQLETMWVPVETKGARRFLGMTVRLRPSADKMPEACYATPWVTEAIIIYFNDHPMAQASAAEIASPTLAKALLERSNAVAGPGVFKQVELIDGPGGPLDIPEAELTLACL